MQIQSSTSPKSFVNLQEDWETSPTNKPSDKKPRHENSTDDYVILVNQWAQRAFASYFPAPIFPQSIRLENPIPHKHFSTEHLAHIITPSLQSFADRSPDHSPKIV